MQDKIVNTEGLERCQICGIKAMIHIIQLRCANTFAKAIFFGQLAQGNRSRGRPVKRYKDCLKVALKECSIDPNSWETAALNRISWRKLYHVRVKQFEEDLITAAVEKCHCCCN